MIYSIDIINYLQRTKRGKGSPGKLLHLSSGHSSGLDSRPEFVNKLLEYWLKKRSAVVFDDQVNFVDDNLL